MNQSLIPFKQEELGNIWRNLNSPQKIGIGALVITAITAIIFFITWAQTPDYVAAFTDISSTDGAAIVTYLKENNIPYEVAEFSGGTTIRVPSTQVHEIRLSLASQGLPSKGTVGFELFDTASLGATEFSQQVNYQRALEGELARTIADLSVVKAARIHIVIPQDSLFTDEQQPATAAIMVDVESGKQISKEQVTAINHLVSSAVEGLTPDNVTIIDMNGNVLSDGEGQSKLSNAIALNSSQIDTQRDIEKNIENRVKSMLENVLGPNQAVVRASALINWDQIHTENEAYVPAQDGSVLRSSRIITQYSADGVNNAGGVPGASSNIPDAAPTYPTGVTSTNSSNYQYQDVTQNFEVSRSTSVVESATGEIKRLSVSVLVDNITDTLVISAIKESTIAAAGLDLTRGDMLTVNSLPFDKGYFVAEEAAMKSAQQREFYLLLARWGVVAVALGAIFLLVRNMQKGLKPIEVMAGTRITKTANGQLATVGADGSTTILDPQNALLKQIDAANYEFDDLGGIAPPQFSEDQKEAAAKAQMVRQLQLMAKNKPETIAQIIQFWLAED